MRDFSVKKYLLDNRLADETGELLESATLPSNPDWGLGPYASWEAMIYLCTLIHFFEDKCMLDNLDISLRKSNDFYFEILIDEKDKGMDYAHPNFEWNLIIETIDHLLPHMASSNVSWLSGGLFHET